MYVQAIKLFKNTPNLTLRMLLLRDVHKCYPVHPNLRNSKTKNMIFLICFLSLLRQDLDVHPFQFSPLRWHKLYWKKDRNITYQKQILTLTLKHTFSLQNDKNIGRNTDHGENMSLSLSPSRPMYSNFGLFKFSGLRELNYVPVMPIKLQI